MLTIEPTTHVAINLKSKANNTDTNYKTNDKRNKSMLTGTLIGLAAIGAAVLGFKKTSPITYEEALKKAGIQIKDNIATIIETGEKFTGKIERLDSRNKKETVQFVNGLMTEKLYHNLFGKELEGCFYKDGKQVLHIWKSIGQAKGSYGFSYKGVGVPIVKPVPYIETREGFAWAREFLKRQG